MNWIPGAQIIAGNSAGDYHGLPFRVVLHTTEGSTIEGAVSAYRTNNSWPHLTIDPSNKRVAQHVALTKAARSLKNLAGGVQTNFANAIQIEIVGRAATSQDWSAETLDWIGGVLGPIMRDFGVSFAAPAFVGTEAGTIATPTARQRLSHSAWNTFSGVCGHQHVPENGHWDPGKLDIARVLTAAANGNPIQVGPAPVQPPVLPVNTFPERLRHKPIIQMGSKGQDAQLVQGVLAAHVQDVTKNFPIATWADGNFGPNSVRVLGVFQSRTPLPDDHIVNGDDWEWLLAGLGTETIKIGDKGPAVKLLQGALMCHARDLVQTKASLVGKWVDGDFGPGTDYVLRTWQARTKVLLADGKCGPLTRNWLAGV